ncbi:class I SAM-dependent methyltransferase [Sphingobacterium spiritivorum]|uniref:class I SAM-dependent methyltransferase n=1 Tax=Sphingobacterium spiritivorum TaxID=258 RepID=UPI003DA4B866
MNKENNYIEINKTSWNTKTTVHINSDFYDVENFKKGKSSLNDIELQLLGDIKGKKILHLQCHFGQDTLSLARMGANVTGIDLSDKAIQVAQELATELELAARFICSDVYELPQVLEEEFDIVYTSYGTIGWLPDLDKWASVVSKFLKPDGKFAFVEFHPFMWVWDDDFKYIQYSYFKDGAIIENVTGSYADREADITHETVSWNHALEEVFNSLIGQQLTITSFNEYKYSPYSCFNNLVEIAPQQFQVRGMENKIPMVYSLTASKPKV